MTLPPLFHVALKTSEEIERESELKRAYEQGYKAGCASHSDAGKERERVLGEAIACIHKKVSFPTNSGEQISCDASIRLGIIHDLEKLRGERE